MVTVAGQETNNFGEEAVVLDDYVIPQGENTYTDVVTQLQRFWIKGFLPGQPHSKSPERPMALPLTAKQSMMAKLDVFESDTIGLEEKIAFFRVPVVTSTGLLYSGDSTKFKIIPCYSPFFTAKDGPMYVKAEFDEEGGFLLDAEQMKMQIGLTNEETMEHQALVALAEGDHTLLRDYLRVKKSISEKIPEGADTVAFWARPASFPRNTDPAYAEPIVLDSMTSELIGGYETELHWPVSLKARFIGVRTNSFLRDKC